MSYSFIWLIILSLAWIHLAHFCASRIERLWVHTKKHKEDYEYLRNRINNLHEELLEHRKHKVELKEIIDTISYLEREVKRLWQLVDLERKDE
jgi:archaellum component FlaC